MKKIKTKIKNDERKRLRRHRWKNNTEDWGQS
jgi:hypothetical protein